MKKKINFILIFIYFLLDLISLSLFHSQFTYFLYIGYVASLLNDEIPITCISILLISLKSLMTYDIFGLELIYLIPIILLYIKLKEILYNKVNWGILLFLSIMLFKFLFIEKLLLHWNGNFLYTFYKIIVNLLLLVIILKFKDRMDNRV